MSTNDERFRIVINDGTEWFMRNWSETTRFLDTKLLYAVEEIEVGQTLRVTIDRMEMTDAEFDELDLTEEP